MNKGTALFQGRKGNKSHIENRKEHRHKGSNHFLKKTVAIK